MENLGSLSWVTLVTHSKAHRVPVDNIQSISDSHKSSLKSHILQVHQNRSKTPSKNNQRATREQLPAPSACPEVQTGTTFGITAQVLIRKVHWNLEELKTHLIKHPSHTPKEHAFKNQKDPMDIPPKESKSISNFVFHGTTWRRRNSCTFMCCRAALETRVRCLRLSLINHCQPPATARNTNSFTFSYFLNFNILHWIFPQTSNYTDQSVSLVFPAKQGCDCQQSCSKLGYHGHSDHPMPADAEYCTFYFLSTAKNQIFKLHQHLLQYLSIFLVFFNVLDHPTPLILFLWKV